MNSCESPQCYAKIINSLFKGYSEDERNVLLYLYNYGGVDAQHGVEYILSHNVHIEVNTSWKSGFGSRGAWFDASTNMITLNYDSVINFTSVNNRTLSGLSNGAYALIIHEALHLEQGQGLAHSWEGERLAWQVEYRVFAELEHYTLPYDDLTRGVMSANDPWSFAFAVLKSDPAYAIPMMVWYSAYPLPDNTVWAGFGY